MIIVYIKTEMVGEHIVCMFYVSNGMKEVDVFSPIVFSVYVDGLQHQVK